MASRARQLSKLLSSDLLTVDVNNSRIGVNSTAPEETLDVRDSLTVGFDTSTTSRDLHVYSDLGTPVRIETTKTTSNIEFMDSETSSTFNVKVGSVGDNLALKSQSDTTFLTGSGAGTEKMRLTSDGDVGIGTTNPNSILDVFGDITISNGSQENAIRTTPDGKLQFLRNAAANNQITVTIDDENGNIGIGTTSPISGVHLFQEGLRLDTANINMASIAPQIILNEHGTTYGGDTWAIVRDSDSFSIRWKNAAPYILRTTMSGGEISSVFLRGSGLQVDSSGTTIAGALSKGSGSFRIPHPLAGLSTTNDLVHSFVEAPDASNLYAGMVDLVDGTATVNIDTAHRMTEGTFVALNHVQSWSSSNESGYSPVKCSISGNLLTIECQDTSSTDTVYYEVRGIRKDQHMIDTNWTDENGRVITEPPKRVIPE